jgi:hypothetical protein
MLQQQKMNFIKIPHICLKKFVMKAKAKFEILKYE